MADTMSREVWFLNQVSKQKYSDDFVQNLTQLNGTMTSVSKYLISMQQGIDDLNRDIFEIIGDFVDEMIILFTGGTGMDFGLGALKPFFDNLKNIFGINNLMEAITENPIVRWINNMVAGLLDGLNGITGGLFNLDALAARLRGTEQKAIIADDIANQALDGNNALTPVVQQTVTDVITISAPFANSYETMVPGQQVSFPQVLLGATVQNMIAGTAGGSSTLEQVIAIPDSQISDVFINYTRQPRYHPPANSMESAYILSNYAVGRSTVTFAVEAVSGTPCPLYVYISRMLPNGDLQIEWISENQSLSMSGGRAEKTLVLPGIEEIPFDIGEYMIVSIHQFGSGSIRPIMGIERSQINRASDLFPPQQKMNFIRSSLPSVGDKIAKDTQLFSSNWIPWVGIGQRLLTGDPLPRVWYDDFNRGELGNKWSQVGNQPVYLIDGYFQYRSGIFIDAGTARAVYSQPMNYDDQRVTGQAVGNKTYGELNTEPAKLIYRSGPNGRTFCSADIRENSVTIARMLNNVPTTLYVNNNVTNVHGDWFKAEVIDNVHSVYKKSQYGTVWVLVAQHVDGARTIDSGENFRYCGASTQRVGLNTSGGWGNWLAEDAVEQVIE